MKQIKHIKIDSKVWDVVGVLNVTPPGSVGEEEIAYEISGWGDIDGVTHIITDDELYKQIADGRASIID